MDDSAGLQAEARRWLFSPKMKVDRETTCELADIDASRFVGFMKKCLDEDIGGGDSGKRKLLQAATLLYQPLKNTNSDSNYLPTGASDDASLSEGLPEIQ